MRPIAFRPAVRKHPRLACPALRGCGLVGRIVSPSWAHEIGPFLFAETIRKESSSIPVYAGVTYENGVFFWKGFPESRSNLGERRETQTCLAERAPGALVDGGYG